ncbi:MAG: hypothetical protein WAX07_00675 [Candidatus Altiarchaeia archaeon]
MYPADPISPLAAPAASAAGPTVPYSNEKSASAVLDGTRRSPVSEWKTQDAASNNSAAAAAG